MAINWVIGETIQALSDLAHSAENARKESTELTNEWKDENDSLTQSISKYEETKNDLSSLNDELKTNKERGKKFLALKENGNISQNIK